MLTGSCDSANIETMRIVNFEVLLDQCSLQFSFAGYRREQVLRIDLVF